MNTPEAHVLSALVDNASGVLGRVVGLISRRGFNIESLSVGETHAPEISRVTIVVSCDDHALEQIIAQLEKLNCVKKVELTGNPVLRELLLIKVATSARTRSEVLEIASIFRARVVDVSAGSLTVEITGEGEKTGALIELLSSFGILETARTGAAALSRGAGTIYDEKEE